MKRSPILIIAFACISVSSCVSTKVAVNSIYTNGLPIDTLNLVSTMIGPVLQPVLPLIDAAAFNEKTNGISDKILDEEQKLVADYKKILVGALNENLRSTIITGTELNSDNAAKYKVQNGIQIDNKNFPMIFVNDGDLNMVDFGNGKNVNAVFKNNAELKARIAKFSAELNVKTVLISFNRLSVTGVSMFGISGYLRLESYLYLYRSNGDLLMDAYGWTKPTSIDGKQVVQYKIQLDNFKELAQLMSEELANYIK